MSQRLFVRAHSLTEKVLRPADDARYGLQALVAHSLGMARSPLAHSCFDETVITRLRSYLRSGDVLLTRTEHKLTTAVLPGFWIHALAYLGSTNDMVEMGLARHPRVRRHWEAIRSGDRFGSAVHAISPRVTVASLAECLKVDHAAVLRPRCPDADRGKALIESLRHIGKPYDFEFDFAQAERLVCTGLIYRSYQRRGSIDFSLTKRLGRFTLTCDELALCATSEPRSVMKTQGFDLVALILRGSDDAPHFFEGDQAVAHFDAIAAGMRPARDLHV